MPIVTAAEFSRLAGVSKPAVTKAVAAGRVVRSGAGIDTDNPVNATYLAGSHQGAKVRPSAPAKKAAAKKATKAPDTELTAAVFKAQAKRERKKDAGGDDRGEEDLSPEEQAEREKLAKTLADLMGDTVSLDREKKVVDIALKKSMERRHSLKFAQDKGLLVRREDVRRTLAHFNASLSTNILQAPRSAVSTLFAMAKAGASTQEGIVALEKILGTAVAHVLDDTADAI